MEAVQNFATTVATLPMSPVFVVAHMILVSLSLRSIPGILVLLFIFAWLLDKLNKNVRDDSLPGNAFNLVNSIYDF